MTDADFYELGRRIAAEHGQELARAALRDAAGPILLKLMSHPDAETSKRAIDLAASLNLTHLN